MIVYRHILKEHIAPFFYAIGVITFIFIMDLTIQLMDSILSKGLNPKVILEVFVLNIAWMLALSVPMAVLVSTLMAFGRLSSDNEITALKSSGVNIYQMLAAPVVASVVICVGTIYFSNTILPDSNHKVSVLMSDISRKKPAAFIQAGNIISDFEGYRILIGQLDAKTSVFKDIKIYEENRQGNPATTYAAHGKLEYIQNGDYLRFTLFDGEIQQNDAEDPGKFFIARFSRQVVNIRNADHQLQRTKRDYRDDRELSAAMMQERVDAKRAERNKTAEEVWRRIESERNLYLPLYGQKEAADSALAAAAEAKIHEPLVILSAIERQRSTALQLNGLRLTYDAQTQYMSRYLVEIYKKYSIPVASVVFALIGAPLGIMARAGGLGVGSAYSLLFFVIYWACLIGGETLADKNLIPPFWAMWAPNFLIGVVGIWLILSLSKETPVFSYRWMGKWAKRLGFVEEETAEPDNVENIR